MNIPSSKVAGNIVLPPQPQPSVPRPSFPVAPPRPVRAQLISRPNGAQHEDQRAKEIATIKGMREEMQREIAELEEEQMLAEVAFENFHSKSLFSRNVAANSMASRNNGPLQKFGNFGQQHQNLEGIDGRFMRSNLRVQNQNGRGNVNLFAETFAIGSPAIALMGFFIGSVAIAMLRPRLFPSAMTTIGEPLLGTCS
jgi:hypothetical protein